ncbi:MAG: glycine zipper 2TM domain-containing protein [Burkholderiales bacterium]|nr:glycine zipper 2TM domain-containing protein [Burkholderiales bacterium]
MRLPNRFVLGALLVAALAGCAASGPQEQSGMIVGGVLGGIIGSQVGQGAGRTAATILGTVIGANIGGNVGRSMDESDRLKTAHALENVRTSVPSSWVNPDTRNSYTVVPTRTFETASGPCREYTVDAVIGGRIEKVVGTACRQADGSWRAQN